MGEPLTIEEFYQLLTGYERTAFRLEQQGQYKVEAEKESLARFSAGDPLPPTEVPSLTEWYATVKEMTDRGLTMVRVRVQEDPPTPYQQWENWIGKWNIDSGEILRRMTRQRAHEIGLLPAAGDQDWWLLDEQRLIVMTFDGEGNKLRYELVTDEQAVEQASAWRDLAVLHSAPDTPDGSSGA